MSITLEEQIAAVAREIAMRKNVYPKWVLNGRMKQDKAEHEIAAMEAVIETVKIIEPLLDILAELAVDFEEMHHNGFCQAGAAYETCDHKGWQQDNPESYALWQRANAVLKENPS